jgi:AraC-like DNA-binding protein
LPSAKARPVDLLSASPLIGATNRTGMIEGLERAYRVRGAEFQAAPDAFVGLANRVSLPDVTFHYCRYDAGTVIRFPRMDGYRQFFCLGGSGRVTEGRRSIDIQHGRTGIVPPNCRFDAEYGQGYRHLVLQFDEAALQRKIELLEIEAGDALQLPVFENLPAEQVWRLRDMALGLAAQFDAGHRASPLLVTELSQALVTAFLTENGAAAGRLQDAPPAGVALVRRLEDYINAHWDEPLTVESVAAACGTSVRSVFSRFHQNQGCTPASYIRGVRLDQARRLLSDPGSTLTVLDAALRCGFASFGHFARRYRERFGELPSQTLERRRAPRENVSPR